MEEQKALQLPFHLRNLTVLSPRLAHIFGVNSRAILAASQLYFVDILIIGYNIKGGSKSFLLQSALCSSYKAFQSGDHRSMTKKSTKKLYSSSAVYFVRKNASSRPLYCFFYGQDGEQERSSFSNEMEVAKLSAPPNLEVRCDRTWEKGPAWSIIFLSER